MNLKLRSSTICAMFLFLSIAGLLIVVAAPNVEAMAWSVGIFAKSTTGTSLSGIQITALSVGGTAYSYRFVTPIRVQLSEGQWTFTAPLSAKVGGVTYGFARWESSVGYVISTSNSFTYIIASSRDFYAVYSGGQVTGPIVGGFSITVTVTDSSGKAIFGATVYLDGSQRGMTDYSGRFVITGVSSGSHALTVKKSGYKDATQQVYVQRNTSVTLRLQQGGLGPGGGFTVTVTVTDSSGHAVFAAIIYLDSIQKGTTDYGGRFVMTGVPSGPHTFKVKKTGYQDGTQVLYVQRDMTVLFRLPIVQTACDPSYPTVCIPSPPPDLDCKDIPYRRFRVLAPDPHHFDGDFDGIGCEWD